MIAIRVICGDGSEVRITKPYFEKMTLFDNPEIVRSRSYTLQCKASSQLVNLLLDRIDGDSEMKITDSNFDQLQSLCRELGFSGLDKELAEFERQSGANGLEAIQKPTHVVENPNPPMTTQPKVFVCDLSESGMGIIAHLTFECAGNVYDKGVVVVIGNNIPDDPDAKKRYARSNMIEIHRYHYRDMRRNFVSLKGNDYCSMDKENSWICYDFKQRRVIPSSYLLGSRILKCWVIEVSNDGYSWMEIDRQDNVRFKNQDTPESFKISHIPSESFRFFRLRQTGKNHSGDDRLSLTSLEIFGTLSMAEHEETLEREFMYHAERERQSSPPLWPPKFDGIIAHLTSECGGNVHEKGIVNVTETSILSDRSKSSDGEPKSAADLELDSHYYLLAQKDAFICYDFKGWGVIPTSYSVRSGCGGPGAAHLKSWVVEASNDRYSWTELDRRDNNNDLNDKFATANFGISCVPHESFRFFRLRETGPNHADKYGSRITALEVFGSMRRHPKQRQREFVYHAKGKSLFPPPLTLPKLDGIIAELTRECGGNVHRKEIVSVTGRYSATRGAWMDDSRKYVLDLMTNKSYIFYGDAWICYNFKERRVIPTSYTLKFKPRSGEPDDLIPHQQTVLSVSWVIEVSNDGCLWEALSHEHVDTSDTDTVFRNFKLERVPDEGFQLFRIRGTLQDNCCLEISALEIFGTLCEK